MVPVDSGEFNIEAIHSTDSETIPAGLVDVTPVSTENETIPPALVDITPINTDYETLPTYAVASVKEIENMLKEFYGVDDLSKLGKLGRHLKKMLEKILDEIAKSGNVESLEIKKIYKDGKYVLTMKWDEPMSDLHMLHMLGSCKIEHELTFEAKVNKDGKISPTKLSWEKIYDNGVVGATFPREIHTFTFDSNGIAKETIKYIQGGKPIVPPPYKIKPPVTGSSSTGN